MNQINTILSLTNFTSGWSVYGLTFDIKAQSGQNIIVTPISVVWFEVKVIGIVLILLFVVVVPSVL